MVASTIGAVAKNLGQLCEKHGGQVSYLEHGKSLLKQLIEGKHELLMVELNFIEGEHRDLVSRIRSQRELQDLFVVVYAPAEMTKNEQAAVNGVNSILTAPFSDTKILSLFKRAFSLPKQCLFLSSSTQEEFIAALQSMGYDLQQLSSAKEALEDNSYNVPDFIIVEYNLSDMSATEFVEQTKENDRLKNVPIMIAYNGREAGEIEQILTAGINDVILSPFASAQNIKRIQDKFPLPPRVGVCVHSLLMTVPLYETLSLACSRNWTTKLKLLKMVLKVIKQFSVLSLISLLQTMICLYLTAGSFVQRLGIMRNIRTFQSL